MGDGYKYANGACSCDTGYSEITYNNTMLCKADKQLTSCNGAEVEDKNNDEQVCYTDTTITALYNACIGDLWLKDNDDNTPSLVGCINEGHGATIEGLIGQMFGNACKNNNGIPEKTNDPYGERYCYICTAPNTIAKDIKTCMCKNGYTDDDNDMSNGCEASAQ